MSYNSMVIIRMALVSVGLLVEVFQNIGSDITNTLWFKLTYTPFVRHKEFGL
jgi:hypothetical protein